MSSITTCHDFKTPRTDSSKRLPPSFVFIPVMFYISLVGAAYLSISSYASFREATKNRDTFRQFQADQETAKAKFESQKTDVNKERRKAEKLAQWIEGTRALQPISAVIARSVPPEITLTDLAFERSAELPAQIHVNVHINNGTLDEVARIQNGLQQLSYRCYNSQEVKLGDLLEFKTTLVWQQF